MMKCEHPGCDKELVRPAHRRKTNLCKRHALQLRARSLAYRQRLSEGQQRRFADECDRIQHGRSISRGLRAALADPDKMAAAQARGRTVGATNQGRVWDPEVSRARARAISDARLADIPPNLRDEYRALAKKHKEPRAKIKERLLRPMRQVVKLDLKNAPSGMELLAQQWRDKANGK